MNGRFRRWYACFQCLAWGGGGSRLAWALLLSALLHGLLFVAPALVRERFVPSAPQRTLSATIIPDRPGVIPAPRLPLAASKSDGPSAVLVGQEPSLLRQAPEAVDESGEVSDGRVFYPSGMLTAAPRALSEARVDDSDFDAGESAGRAVLELWVDREGKVVLVNSLSSGLSGRATAAMLDAFRSLRFKPGEIDGQPVGVILKIEAGYADDAEPVESGR